MNAKSIYFKASFSIVLANMLQYGVGFFSVWILTRYLAKSGYGTFVFFMNIIFLVSTISYSGLEKLLLYKIPRLIGTGEGQIKSAIINFSLSYGMSAATLTALLLTILFFISQDTNEDLAFAFLPALIPFYVALQIYQAWLRALQKIPTAVVYGQVVFNAIKLFLLCLLFLFPWKGYAVVSIIASHILAFIIVFIRYPFKFLFEPKGITRWDISYILKSTSIKIVNVGNDKLSIIAIGAFSTSTVVADFSVALQISAFIVLGHGILSSIYVTRIGKLISDNETEALIAEFDQTRFFATALALFGLVSLLLLGKIVLFYLGGYEEAFPALIVLALAQLTNVSFGPNGPLLLMHGNSEELLYISILVLVCIVGLVAFLTPSYGGVGAAAALSISLLFGNIATNFFIYRSYKIALYPIRLAVVIFLCWLFVFLFFFADISENLGASVLFLVLLLYLLPELLKNRRNILQWRNYLS